MYGYISFYFLSAPTLPKTSRNVSIHIFQGVRLKSENRRNLFGYNALRQFILSIFPLQRVETLTDLENGGVAANVTVCVPRSPVERV